MRNLVFIFLLINSFIYSQTPDSITVYSKKLKKRILVNKNEKDLDKQIKMLSDLYNTNDFIIKRYYSNRTEWINSNNKSNCRHSY